MPLRDDQIRRYARHILLPDVGGVGQERLLDATVEIPVGRGCSANLVALTYLAAAGVGRIVVSGDPLGPVEAGDLTGGLVLSRADLGQPRLDALRARIAALNPDVELCRGGVADHDVDARLDCCDQPARAEVAAIDALIRGGDAATAVLSSLARQP